MVPKLLARGWQISTIYTALSGRPFTPLISGDPSGQGLSSTSLRASYDGSPIQYNHRNPDAYVVENSIDDSGAFDPTLLDPCGRSPFSTLADGVTANPAYDSVVNKTTLPVTPFYIPCNGTIGNSRRGMLRGPGLSQWDATVIKDTKVGEHFTVQFRWEVFNLFNRGNFAPFVSNNVIGSGSFGQITSTPDVAVGNPVIAQGGPRSMNFALKIMF